MDQQEEICIVNGYPILRKEGYVFWSTRMKIYLKALGHDVWNSVITDYFPPNRIRTPTQKKSKKINSMAMDSILDGLPDDVKEKIGECNSAKELWDKIKDLHSVEQRAEERLAFLKDVSEDEKISEDEENLFIGTTNPDEESEVDIEAQYMAVVDEIEKCREKNKDLKEKLSKYQEEKKSKPSKKSCTIQDNKCWLVWKR